MSNHTTQNFIKALTAFQWPDPQPVSYRLYHDEQGQPLFYSMESLPGTYIEVDKDVYVRGSHHLLVRDGKLVHLEPLQQVSRVVKHSELGTPCHPKDVCVVVDVDQPHQKWKKQINDIN